MYFSSFDEFINEANEPKKTVPKPVVKAPVKKTVAKPTAKPKPIPIVKAPVKTTTKVAAPKPVVKAPVKKTVAKAPVKTTTKVAAPKPVVKAPVKKIVAKAPVKTVTKVTATKPTTKAPVKKTVTKPVAKKTTTTAKPVTKAPTATKAKAPTKAPVTKHVAPKISMDQLLANHEAFISEAEKSKKLPIVSIAQAKTKLAAVAFLQSFLSYKGYAGTSDGMFGPTTKNNAIAYQKAKGLTADGVVGIKSWQKVFKDLDIDSNEYTSYKTASSDVTASSSKNLEDLKVVYKAVLDKFKSESKVPSIAVGLKGAHDEVKLLQSYLSINKYGTLKVDGLFGKGSAGAVKMLQNKFRLSPDGKVGVKTWIPILKDLGLDSSKFASYTLGAATGTKTISELSTVYNSLINDITKNKEVPFLSDAYKVKYAYTEMLQKYMALKSIPTNTDGMFGDGTKKSVIAYQKTQKLSADGKVGVNTWLPVIKAIFNVDIAGYKTFNPVDRKEETKVVSAASTKEVEKPNGNAEFYPMSEQKLATFNSTRFSIGDDKSMTGLELVSSGKLKNPQELHNLIIQNKDGNSTSLILLAAQKESPLPAKTPVMNLLATGSFTLDIGMSIFNVNSPALDAEMFYSGLRGVGAVKKMINSSIPKLIQLRSRSNEEYRKFIAERFKVYVDKDPTYQNKYNKFINPLRQWLYEEFKGKEPFKWMNYLTVNDDDDTKRHETELPTSNGSGADVTPAIPNQPVKPGAPSAPTK